MDRASAFFGCVAITHSFMSNVPQEFKTCAAAPQTPSIHPGAAPTSGTTAIISQPRMFGIAAPNWDQDLNSEEGSEMSNR